MSANNRALSWVIIECPSCGYRKRVTLRPVSRRVCPRCRKYFADPLTTTR
jgi:RNase P subunit RPR2